MQNPARRSRNSVGASNPKGTRGLYSPSLSSPVRKWRPPCDTNPSRRRVSHALHCHLPFCDHAEQIGRGSWGVCMKAPSERVFSGPLPPPRAAGFPWGRDRVGGRTALVLCHARLTECSAIGQRRPSRPPPRPSPTRGEGVITPSLEACEMRRAYEIRVLNHGVFHTPYGTGGQKHPVLRSANVEITLSAFAPRKATFLSRSLVLRQAIRATIPGPPLGSGIVARSCVVVGWSSYGWG